MLKNRKFNVISLFLFSLVIFVVLILLLYTGVINEYYGGVLTLGGIYIIVALSLNLITGFTGQLSLGQAGFMSVGAYSAAIANMTFHMPLVISILIGGLVSALFGILIGFPTLRLKGDYLAITTLGFGEIIRVIMNNAESLTGGAAGLKGVPPFSNTGDFILDLLIKFSWVYVFVILTIVVMSNLLRSTSGRAIISIREDEIASASMGINVPYYKMFSFTLSAFIAGVGGGLYASYIGYLNPTMFGFLISFNYVVIVVLGGMGSITGTILAGIIFAYFLEVFRTFKDLVNNLTGIYIGDYNQIIFGLGLILIMLFWQTGLMGSKEFSIVKFTKDLLAGEYKPGKIQERMKKAKMIKKTKKSTGNKEVI